MGIMAMAIPLALAVLASGTHGWAAGRAEAEAERSRMSKGKTLYIKHCVGCHGTEGKGDGYKLLGADPANLTSPSTQKQSDSALLRTIHEGRSTMPSWKVRLSERDSRAVLAYIRSLAR